jgi:hypothetical protein
MSSRSPRAVGGPAFRAPGGGAEALNSRWIRTARGGVGPVRSGRCRPSAGFHPSQPGEAEKRGAEPRDRPRLGHGGGRRDSHTTPTTTAGDNEVEGSDREEIDLTLGEPGVQIGDLICRTAVVRPRDNDIACRRIGTPASSTACLDDLRHEIHGVGRRANLYQVKVSEVIQRFLKCPPGQASGDADCSNVLCEMGRVKSDKGVEEYSSDIHRRRALCAAKAVIVTGAAEPLIDTSVSRCTVAVVFPGPVGVPTKAIR